MFHNDKRETSIFVKLVDGNGSVTANVVDTCRQGNKKRCDLSFFGCQLWNHAYSFGRYDKKRNRIIALQRRNPMELSVSLNAIGLLLDIYFSLGKVIYKIRQLCYAKVHGRRIVRPSGWCIYLKAGYRCTCETIPGKDPMSERSYSFVAKQIVWPKEQKTSH